jgi:glycosyltransferase involved in cell wall biosynthesis
MRARVLLVGRTRYRLPPSPTMERKFAALREELDVHVLGSAPAGAPTRADGFTLVAPLRPRALDGLAFWLALPFRTARLLRRLRPDAVVAQTAYEAAAAMVGRRLARSQTRIVLEVHGDWRTSTRLYGASHRRLLAGLGDAVAAAAVRRADAVRTVSPFTSALVRELGVEPLDTFPAFMDLEPFTGRAPVPLPERPRVLFVAVLEAYKNVDGLAEAWRLASARVPQAELHLVGKGSRTDVVEQLVRDVPGRTRWTPELSVAGVAEAMDEATVLVLPSRSEGMGRVLVEAFCRGRGIVGTRAGSIPDLVEDGVNGLLAEPDDAQGLADLLVRALVEPGLAERLGAAARERADAWLQTPEEYAVRIRELVEGRSSR